MTFADLHIGDYFLLIDKPYIRLQEYIMSLDKGDFGLVYTMPSGSCPVEFLSSFEYKPNPYLAVDSDINPNNVPIDKAPSYMLLQSVNTNSLYVKIKAFYGTGDNLIYVKTLMHQGSFCDSARTSINVRIVDAMTVVYDEKII